MSASVELRPLFDPTLDRVGFPLDLPYIEQVYCSALGPSSVLLLRHAGQLFADHPEGARVDLVDLSRSLGLGRHADGDELGRNAPLRRTMDRLVRFRAASWLDDDRLGIHPKLPALERHRAARLAEPVQAVHQRLLTDHLAGLVAKAEGRDLPTPAVEPPAATKEAPAAGRADADVAARLRAFGTAGHEPQIIVR